jgi:hypothetical protein
MFVVDFCTFWKPDWLMFNIMLLKCNWKQKFLPPDQTQNHTLIIAWKAIILSHEMAEGNAKLCLKGVSSFTIADGQFLLLHCASQ